MHSVNFDANTEYDNPKNFKALACTVLLFHGCVSIPFGVSLTFSDPCLLFFIVV